MNQTLWVPLQEIKFKTLGVKEDEALQIILGKVYSNYEESCTLLSCESLSDRRDYLCLIKCAVKSGQHKNTFIPAQSCHNITRSKNNQLKEYIYAILKDITTHHLCIYQDFIIVAWKSAIQPNSFTQIYIPFNDTRGLWTLGLASHLYWAH